MILICSDFSVEMPVNVFPPPSVSCVYLLELLFSMHGYCFCSHASTVFHIDSFENNHLRLIENAAATGNHLNISTVMVSFGEFNNAILTAPTVCSIQLALLKFTNTYLSYQPLKHQTSALISPRHPGRCCV